MITEKDRQLIAKGKNLTDDEKEYLFKKSLRLLNRANNLLRKVGQRLAKRAAESQRAA